MRLGTAAALLLLLLAAATAVFPGLDFAVSGLFYTPAGFAWREAPWAMALHDAVRPLSLTLGGLLLVTTVLAALRRRPVAGLDARAAGFLLAALLLGPGLVGNTLLKDNWHRARPHQVTEFGGELRFTPALVRSDQCDHNCSFVSGDATSGFWLHSFAYVVPARARRRVLLAGLGAGAGLGLLRIGMGAHFFSDVLFAGLVVVACTALVYLALYGRARSAELWRDFKVIA
jgi:membrane-associated PAP2 superfamily phosphatase